MDNNTNETPEHRTHRNREVVPGVGSVIVATCDACAWVARSARSTVVRRAMIAHEEDNR